MKRKLELQIADNKRACEVYNAPNHIMQEKWPGKTKYGIEPEIIQVLCTGVMHIWIDANGAEWAVPCAETRFKAFLPMMNRPEIDLSDPF